MIVIDASALVKLVLEEEHSKEAREIVNGELAKGETILAPELIFAEALNTMRTQSVSSKRFGGKELENAIDDLFDIFGRIESLSTIRVGRKALDVSLKHKITVYDALYIASSLLNGTPLLTFDRGMATAARQLDIGVLGSLGS